MKLLLLGAPGSGKGTVSNKLVNDFNFTHISTGNLFREILKSETKIAEEVRGYLYNGELVPDALTNIVLKEAVMENIDKNLVFDGYPRNNDQARFLSHICEIDFIILLEINEEMIIQRALGRRICPTCSTIYNISHKSMDNTNICTKDNSILVQRKDDNLETIKNRIKVYNETSKELISFYEHQKKVYRIDSNQDIESVMNETIKLIKVL